MKRILLIYLLTVLIAVFSVKAQVSVVSSLISDQNITVGSMFGLVIMNAGNISVQATVTINLVNSIGELICNGRSNPFILAPGINRLTSDKIGVAQFIFGESDQAGFIQISHRLPSGKYKYCAIIAVMSEEQEDKYCEDLESSVSSFLELISPYDGEEILSKNPLLIWTHNEPFSLLHAGESFRILVTEISEDQGAGAAILANRPIFYRENLKLHDVLYPYNAPELVPGQDYAWQVQKISGGNVIQRTEAWKFHLPPPPSPILHQFVVLTDDLQTGYYTPVDNKIWFSFEEGYDAGVPDCVIYSFDRIKTLPVANQEESDTSDISEIKRLGDNRFVIDLASYHLTKGIYTLEIKNIKKEVLVLKFYMK